MKKITLLTCIAGLFTSLFSVANQESQVAAPILIPFNQVLFNSYCTYKADECERAGERMFKACVTGMVFTAIGAYSLSQMGGKITGSWDTWCNAHGVYSSVCGGGGLALQVFSGMLTVTGLISSVRTMCSSIVGLGSQNYDEQIEAWNRLICVSRDEQERLWHTTIYEKFGKPVIYGTLQDGVRYTLKFDKKNGIGCVILDPYALEDVSILLGIHEKKKDTCLCDDIYIVM